jgi:pyruvate dehydrogenase E2 component (dihydrolipoamide acetyltransferase)
MAKAIKVPDIGEGVDEGSIISILIEEGDTVEADQTILEMETDKAVVDIPCPEAGKVTELKVEEGDTIQVGDVILMLEPDEKSETDKSETDTDSGDDADETTDGETDDGTDETEDDDAGDTDEDDEEDVEEKEEIGSSDEEGKEPVPASPYVRRLSRRLGVDINVLKGSGRKGRILEDDLFNHVKETMTQIQSDHQNKLLRLPEEQRPLSRVRQITADVMTEAWKTIPQVAQFGHADITDIEAFRKEFNQKNPNKAKITITSILMKICGQLLLGHANFNSSYNGEQQAIHVKSSINIGIAVDTHRGLLVPVIREVPEKGISTLSEELIDIAKRTRDKTIKPDELKDGTFTISNLGGIGGDWFTPIIYPPQVAILGVGRAELRPIWRHENWIPRNILPLSLVYDHRVIDGADGARFLQKIVKALEYPVNLIMET